MSPTTVLFIRHGQTDWNVARRWQGHRDIPLNRTGREQAELLARRLSSWPISAVYASDLQRAAETATIVARRLNLQCVTDTVWRERHGGVFQGLTREEIADNHPEAWAEFKRGLVNPPGGETMAQLQQRVAKATKALAKRHDGETVAVVSHGGTLRALLYYVLDMLPDEILPIRVNGNTGISVIEIVGERPPLLVRLNDVAHLEMSANRVTG
ncbi:MAG TPA: histidine phosphatase family protein [Candidatus Sulfomarinibacteraceae bacterium]|nr:histidine phosphatase family protein [Candidatus Sulfomarinibacteraceae bacterium]